MVYEDEDDGDGLNDRDVDTRVHANSGGDQQRHKEQVRRKSERGRKRAAYIVQFQALHGREDQT